MRNNYDPGIKTKNRLNGESIAMGIHAGALQKVMDILTNLYSDPAAAVIREYSTNARDSHIAAGKADVPIKVTLPTTFAPSFTVQDFGVGLSVDDLRDIYSQYGASTKEDNDDETGYLGMGSKSGLTFTDQFTVTAIKGGVKTSAVVARSDDGAASIRILDTSSTTDSNGVTITIPVGSNVSNFVSKAESFFKWWKAGTVDLINGDHRPVEGRPITDDIQIISGGRNYVVMGGVGYPVNDYEVNLGQMLPYNEAVVCFVPMGSVNFTPSREELHYTKLTKDTLSEYQAKVKANVIAAAEREVAEAANHTEAILAARRWRQTLSNHPWRYKGTPLPPINYGGLQIDEALKYSPSNYGKRKASPCEYLDLNDLDKYVFVTGFTGKTLTTNVRAKMDKYAEDNQISGSVYVFCDVQGQLPWTEACTSVAYDTIKAVKLPKTAKGSYAPSPWDVYRVHPGGSAWAKETDIQDKNLVYLSPAWLGEAPRRGGRLTMEHLTSALPNVTFISAGANRWERLIREYPHAKALNVALCEAVAAKIKAMSEDAKAGVADQYVFNTFQRLVSNRYTIEDADVAAVVASAPKVQRAAEPYNDYLRNVEHVRRILRYYDVSIDTAKVESELVTKAHEALDTYPFIRYTNEAGIEHTVAYINAIHKENSK